MGVAQTQKAEEKFRAALPSNPLIPPKGDICFINNLPPELLSRIFEIGSEDCRTEYQVDVTNGDRDVLWQHLQAWQRKELVDALEDERKEDEDEDEEVVTDGEADSDDSSEFTASYDPPPPWFPFLIVISHVCRLWRNVAISTPSLWTTMVIIPAECQPSKPKLTLLKRSKNLPIEVYICCQLPKYRHYTEPPSDDDLGSLLSILTPHVERWRTMHVTVFSYSLMHVFLSAVSDTPAPQLTTLELFHYEAEGHLIFGYNNTLRNLTLFGGSAPLLTRIVLWGVHVDWNQPWITSASNLIDLQLAFHPDRERPSWTQFSSILRGASALKKLSLCHSGPSGNPREWLTDPIRLPRVTDFQSGFDSLAYVIGLFHRFDLPALKNLVLDFQGDDYTSLVHELAAPATSLSPTKDRPRSLLSRLESLKIGGLPCHVDCLPTLFSELENLTSLDISSSPSPTLFLVVLGAACTLIEQGNVLLPRLEKLYVTRTTGTVLRGIVQRRRNAGVPLSELYVEMRCEIDDEDMEWLLENVETVKFCETFERGT